MERRREDRVETSLRLTCRVPARPRASVMHDVSPNGCKLEFGETEVETGGSVVIDVPGARSVTGRIVWAEGKQAGIAFDERLTGSASLALGLGEPESLLQSEPVAVEPVTRVRPAKPDRGSGVSGLLRGIGRLAGRAG